MNYERVAKWSGAVALLSLAAVVVLLLYGCNEAAEPGATSPTIAAQPLTFEQTTNLDQRTHGPLWVNWADGAQQQALQRRLNGLAPFGGMALDGPPWFMGIRVDGTEPDTLKDDPQTKRGTDQNAVYTNGARRLFFFYGQHADTLGLSTDPLAVLVACHDYWATK